MAIWEGNDSRFGRLSPSLGLSYYIHNIPVNLLQQHLLTFLDLDLQNCLDTRLCIVQQILQLFNVILECLKLIVARSRNDILFIQITNVDRYNPPYTAASKFYYFNNNKAEFWIPAKTVWSVLAHTMIIPDL